MRSFPRHRPGSIASTAVLLALLPATAGVSAPAGPATVACRSASGAGGETAAAPDDRYGVGARLPGVISRSAAGRKADGAESGITHGPMLGNIRSNGVRIWARTRTPGEFRVAYATREDLRDVQWSKPARTTHATDNTGWTELTGLAADTRYHYAIAADAVVPTRENFETFWTLPDANERIHPTRNPRGLFNFSFLVGSCNHQQTDTQAKYGRPLDAPYATMLSLLRDRVRFQILNGDWIYEEAPVAPFHGQRGRATTVAEWAAENSVAAVPELLELAPEVAGVWENYKIYLERGRNLAAFHRTVPGFVTFDDHEIYNDVIGTGHPGLRVDSRADELRRSPFDPAVTGLFRPLRKTPEAEVERAVFRDPALQAWEHYVGWANPDAAQRRPIHFGRADAVTGSSILHDPRADFHALELEKSGTLHVH